MKGPIRKERESIDGDGNLREDRRSKIQNTNLLLSTRFHSNSERCKCAGFDDRLMRRGGERDGEGDGGDDCDGGVDGESSSLAGVNRQT